MKFVVIDKKKTCFSVYCDGKMHLKSVPDYATHAWSYSPLYGKSVELGSIYANEWNHDKVCPPYLLEQWNSIQSRVNAFLRSIQEAKIPLDSACLYDLVPMPVLEEFCQTKIEILEHVFELYKKPKNYGFMVDLLAMLYDIGERPLNIDLQEAFLKRNEKQAQDLFPKIDFLRTKIEYTPFSAVTGRLVTLPSSFPILNLKKELRTILKPNNDCFLEFDYNSADLRTALGLLGKEQPQEDIHEWNRRNLFPHLSSRQDLKQAIFQELYGSGPTSDKVRKIYDRDEIIKNHWDGRKILTPFQREIKLSERRLAISYIIQSVTSDLVLAQAVKIAKLLEGRKSYIAFLIHDSIVLDLAEEDLPLMTQAKEEFANTLFGRFLVNVSIGKNYGSMKKV